MSDQLMKMWLKKGKTEIKKPPTVLLPDPTQMKDTEAAASITAANDTVGDVILVKEIRSDRKRNRSGGYSAYSPEVRLKIAQYCLDNGPAKTSRHFSQELGRTVNESTVRSIKKTYLSSPKKELFKTEMPRSPRGRPTLLPSDIDTIVQEYVQGLRVAGAAVNTNIIIAGATGIVRHRANGLLKENGGALELTKDWAKSLMKRMGLIKRKATKGIKTLPDDFEDIKTAYISRLENAIETHDIPDSLIINWDQTGVNLVPSGNWTMEEKGAKQVPLKGMDDKRQITLLLAIAKSGAVLPPQVIYAGLTENCHPKFSFPESWDIYHTASHWSTEESMLRYVEKVIVPYVEHVREEEDLPLRQRALCVFDVFAAHRGQKLLDLLERNGIRVVYVPGACTDRLQPLDLIPNNVFKSYLKAEFHGYYAGEVEKHMNAGAAMADLKIDLRTSAIKPLHAQWLVNAIEKLTRKPDMIVESFHKAGFV